MRTRGILSWMVLAVAASAAQAAPGHYAISTAQIAATVTRFGIAVEPAQVKLLADVVATTDSPRLVVRSIRPWGNQRVMARLECENPAQCMPFFVGVQMKANDSSQTAAGTSTGATGSTLAQLNSPHDYLVRSGTPATLQLDNDHVHIRIQVICLQNGSLGQKIRVTSKDHRITYMAEVVDGSLLKGSL